MNYTCFYKFTIFNKFDNLNNDLEYHNNNKILAKF